MFGPRKIPEFRKQSEIKAQSLLPAPVSAGNEQPIALQEKEVVWQGTTIYIRILRVSPDLRRKRDLSNRDIICASCGEDFQPNTAGMVHTVEARRFYIDREKGKYIGGQIGTFNLATCAEVECACRVAVGNTFRVFQDPGPGLIRAKLDTQVELPAGDSFGAAAAPNA